MVSTPRTSRMHADVGAALPGRPPNAAASCSCAPAGRRSGLPHAVPVAFRAPRRLLPRGNCRGSAQGAAVCASPRSPPSTWNVERGRLGRGTRQEGEVGRGAARSWVRRGMEGRHRRAVPLLRTLRGEVGPGRSRWRLRLPRVRERHPRRARRGPAGRGLIGARRRAVRRRRAGGPCWPSCLGASRPGRAEDRRPVRPRRVHRSGHPGWVERAGVQGVAADHPGPPAPPAAQADSHRLPRSSAASPRRRNTAPSLRRGLVPLGLVPSSSGDSCAARTLGAGARAGRAAALAP